MKSHKAGFVEDGFMRLLRSQWYRQKHGAIKAEVRAMHETELAGAMGYWQRVAVKVKIAREVRHQVKGLGSPYCLWICR